MSAERSELDMTEVPVEATPRMDVAPVVACMGTTACRRVCEYLNDGHDLGQLDPSIALPMERECSVLDGIESIEPTAARELLDATTMPRLDVFGSEAVVSEAQDYLTHLGAERNAFDAYLDTLLAGSRVPRFKQDQDRKTYEQARVYGSANTAEAELTNDEQAELHTFHAQLRGLFDKNMLKSTGLMFDTAMETTLETAAREIGVGHHVRLVGEPGIAKTTLAKYLAFRNARAHHSDEVSDADIQPILIKFSSTTEAESKLEEQTLEDGTLGKQVAEIADAMQRGVGVILDEDNAMPSEQKTFFNDLFLKQSGDPIEVAGRTIIIQPGFSIIATRNAMTDTQGNRRHGRQQQGSAEDGRLTRIDVRYPYQNASGLNPDSIIASGNETISRLFFARYVDSFGWKLPSQEMFDLLDNTRELVKKLTVKATEPTKDGTSTSLTASQARPDLAECITPRDLDRLLTVSFGYSTQREVIASTRQALRQKTNQILSSDNGHFVSPAVKTAVERLLSEGRF